MDEIMSDGTHHLSLPHRSHKLWEPLLARLSSPGPWTPERLVETLEYLQPLEKGTFTQFAEMFSTRTEYEGSVDELWGGAEFGGRLDHPDFPMVCWWFFNRTLPFMVELVTRLPVLFPAKVPLLLPSSSTRSLSLNRDQVAALLAGMFFSLFPTSEELGFQEDVSFLNWQQHPRFNAKLRMLMNYFESRRLGRGDDGREIEIHRLKLAPLSLAKWAKSEVSLGEFRVHESGTIAVGEGSSLRVDFANSYIGGGVLCGGAVQEEIMFATAPELISSMLLCSDMEDDEAIVIGNARTFSDHSGYGSSLRFEGPKLGEEGVFRVAIDATCFSWGATKIQWSLESVLRELNKARVGFCHAYPSPSGPVRTGNWGCGAFGGNIQLKSVVQWCAASLAGRDVDYFTFGDLRCGKMGEMVEHARGWTVGKMMQCVMDYIAAREGRETGGLFDFILENKSHWGKV